MVPSKGFFALIHDLLACVNAATVLDVLRFLKELTQSQYVSDALYRQKPSVVVIHELTLSLLLDLMQLVTIVARSLTK